MTRVPVRRSRPASYTRAIAWLAFNDDNEWTKDEDPTLSVSASMVADLYGRTDQQVTKDLRRKLDKEGLS